jgi:hypothetical protein
MATRRRPTTRAAELLAMKLIAATTMVARGMRHLPMPAPRGAERLALEVAASQLRTLAGEMGLSSTHPVALESAEGKLAELVDETLKLIDAALAQSPELRTTAPHASLPESAPSDDSATPTKVSF